VTPSQPTDGGTMYHDRGFAGLPEKRIHHRAIVCAVTTRARLSVINEVIADGENALHPTDRFGDYAVRFSGLKLVL
jgi:hypothetical protein